MIVGVDYLSVKIQILRFQPLVLSQNITFKHKVWTMMLSASVLISVTRNSKFFTTKIFQDVKNKTRSGPCTLFYALLDKVLERLVN